MGEFKQKIISYLYGIFPLKELQLDKDEFSEMNEENEFLRGVKGLDKTKIVQNLHSGRYF